jgi:hypothetical protein
VADSPPTPASINLAIDGKEEDAAAPAAPANAPQPLPAASTPPAEEPQVPAEHVAVAAIPAEEPQVPAPVPADEVAPAPAQLFISQGTQTTPDEFMNLRDTVRHPQMTLNWLVNAMMAVKQRMFFQQ